MMVWHWVLLALGVALGMALDAALDATAGTGCHGRPQFVQHSMYRGDATAVITVPNP